MDNNPKVNELRHRGERKLIDNWCIWERYQTTYMQNKANYLDSNKIIYNFSSLGEFGMFWKNTNYNECTSVFFDAETKKTRKLKLENGEEKVVECMMLFKKGIEPKWEDPKNKLGGSLIVELADIPNKELDSIWKDLIFSLIGNTFPFSECVNGFRLLDRIKKLNLVKLELWITTGLSFFSDKTDKQYLDNKNKKDLITKALKELICRTTTISEYSIIFKDHYTVNKV